MVYSLQVGRRWTFCGWINNARFLIPPGRAGVPVRSHNLVSRLLSMASRQLVHHWSERYGYCPVLLETFVEQPRFRGTCYKAANLIKIGQTKGTAKRGHDHLVHGIIKDVWLYPLGKNFRQKLLG